MFKPNNEHKRQELFNDLSFIDERSQKLLLDSWAPLYYKHVFCRIDETPFSVLYCADNGRPNFPVNILLSLEFIKHLKGHSDEELIEQFHFNYQIMYAVGIRELGALPLAPRTLYEFRERIYTYTLNHSDEDDLIFEQFQKLTKHFCEIVNTDCSQQRMDSTQIMPNIKKAGRLSLAYDILLKTVKSIPKDKLPESLAKVLEADFKTELLYRCKTRDVSSRLKEIMQLCAQLLDIAKSDSELSESEPVLLVKRFLDEQADFDNSTKEWVPKKSKDISPRSVQSAFDSDATYRKKGKKDYVGYVANIAETCADENPVQFITDYKVEPNSTADTDMLEERLPVIKGAYDELQDMYIDGGYYGSDIVKQAEPLGVDLHYTNMTGVPSKKLPLTDFMIRETDGTPEVKCPKGQEAVPAYYGKDKTLIAHFDLDKCYKCPLRADCPAIPKQNSRVLGVTPKSLIADKTRQKLKDKDERVKSVSCRAAIEGSNSALKRGQNASKLEVRTMNKSKMFFGFKVISRNIRQLVRWAKGDYRRKPNKPRQPLSQGAAVPV